ncbi:MAG: PIG-L family deacetylase [Gemmatimonadetes bacterium]|nr:PIG-L family deacetylase [Gemmatimonadota bacterium]
MLALLFGSALPVRAQRGATDYTGAQALGLALRRTGATERVLMIGAHPDDEDTQLLAALALGRGADVAYLSLTRGDGGQNAIGGEFQEALGLLRTEELLAARRLDGAGQFFTRAYDYGFSKSADEAFRHWPKDSLLGDVVRVIRRFRPDVVVSVFSGTPRDGHGQHQAAGILAKEAFDAAGDPRRFPEQIAAGLKPFTPSKLYQGSWFRLEEATLRIPTGELDPLLGRSYFQVAMASRSRHRSQDQGRALLPGPHFGGVALVQDRSRRPTDAEEGSLLAGIDSTLSLRAAALLPGGSASPVARILSNYDSLIARARAAMNALDPDALVPELVRGQRLLARAEAALPAGDGGAALRFYLEREAADVAQATALAAGLVLDAVASTEQVVPGDTFTLELSLWNGGARPVGVRRLEPVVPAGWTATPLDSGPAPATAAPQTLVTRRFRIGVPADAPPTEPYFLRQPRKGDMYSWPAGDASAGLPFEPPAVRAAATAVLEDVAVPLDREATFRLVSPQDGESRRPIRVVPAASVTLDPGIAILSVSGRHAPLHVTARVTAEARGGVDGMLTLAVPDGWRVQPAAAPIHLTAAGQTESVEFTVTPPAGTRTGSYRLAASVAAGGRRYTRGFRLVDYPHIRPRPLYREAVTLVQAMNVALPRRLRVGYVMGPGDAVPQALQQLGIDVEPLDAGALAHGDLSRFDDIVIGVRAYEVRSDLAASNRRLLDYVRDGGTLIVQYQQYDYFQSAFAPYPMTVARPADRVTDEDASVKILVPTHPALTTPNRISDDDFRGWVQERGLYFPHTWDPTYVPLLDMGDPGEPPLRGALLVAPYGKGTYVYTGLALFRQLPAGVPGAYRLFANLLSLGVR